MFYPPCLRQCRAPLSLVDIPPELLQRVCYQMLQKDLYLPYRTPHAMLLRRTCRRASTLTNLPIQLRCSEDLGTISRKGSLSHHCRKVLAYSTESDHSPRGGEVQNYPFLVHGMRTIVGTQSLQEFGFILPVVRTLVMLDLSQSRIYLQDVSLLQHAVCLEELDLSYCINVQQLFDATHCRRLRTVSLQGCSCLTDLSPLWRCRSLQTLYIDNCISVSSIKGIEECQQLRVLHATSCASMMHLGGLQQCLKLVHLDMTCNRLLVNPLGFSVDATIERVYLSCCSLFDNLQGIGGERLRELRLFGCSSLTTLRGIERCSAIESLNLSCCDSLYDIGDLEGKSSLKIVALSSCGALEDIGVLATCGALTKLGMSHCNGISAMPDLTQTRIAAVNASGCARLRCLHGLRGCARLRNLDISYCRALSSIQDLAECPELHSLNLEHSIMIRSINPLMALKNLRSVKTSIPGHQLVQEPDPLDAQELCNLKWNSFGMPVVD